MKVVLTKQAGKQLEQLPDREYRKVRRKLQLLTTQSQAGKQLRGRLSGLHSLRAWPYRIIYTFDRSIKEVTVLEILHRQQAYQK
ncbi:MAG: hypothetical protein COY80_01495 [Candidatus Pacebacteria bacterium CG_4_10_14_0_8_um_filter_42_14]|nr:MAG: hypothetical protein COY80_01495 [Candidatus Pacebacteria bacterium CG_4_10_14_0_8_um_filter_42_14]